MFCPNCGKELSDGDSFCPGCGRKAGPSQNSNPNNQYNQTPKEPSTLVPFLLGMILGILGVLISILVFSGNDGPYTKNPTLHALVWSIIGMFIWIPIIVLLIVPFIIATASNISILLIALI